MAKQRRPPTRSPKTRSGSSSPPPQQEAGLNSVARTASSAPAPGAAERRSTYIEAVAVYEQGLEKLQQHDYRGAAALFESVLVQYDEEKELHERAKLYLNICQRHVSTSVSAPHTVEERLYASTLALNGGRYDEAILHLRLVRDEDPDNDHALYMLAVAHAQRGEFAEAVAHVERAIAINPENRALAKTDPDLDPVRDDDAFRAALEAPSLRSDRRRPIRPRPAR
jgi:tetratricopeptide (TPR) repeat protein